MSRQRWCAKNDTQTKKHKGSKIVVCAKYAVAWIHIQVSSYPSS